MKKLNSVTLEFKNVRTYFQGNKVLNIAYNFLDKHMNYTTDTIKGDIDNYKITINISFDQTSEVYKFGEIIDLFQELNFLAEEKEAIKITD